MSDGSVQKYLVNDPSLAVVEALDGLVQTNATLSRLDGFPDIKVILRNDWDPKTTEKVAVISGGGSGHEPAHVGYVGENMLTAAVAGDVFASPSPKAILSAIRAVAGSAGVLLIVKNYTGDRLNFGMAAERARADGIEVQTVVVADDCAIPRSKGITGRRGIAGAVMVHKVAGHAAESGAPLSEVHQIAQLAADNVASLGVAFSACTTPGAQIDNSLGPDEIEVGMGIHGEKGYEVQKMCPGNEIVEKIIDIILSTNKDRNYFSVKKGDSVALMVNNLGASMPIEMSIATSHAVKYLQSKDITIARVFTGTYMTALNMHGISISLIRLLAGKNFLEFLRHLDAPTTAPGWNAGLIHIPQEPKIIPLPAEEQKKMHRDEDIGKIGTAMEKAIGAVCDSLIKNESSLTQWDTAIGDGDCGTTLASGAKKILSDLSEYPLQDPSTTFLSLSDSVNNSMGGTSGALYQIFLTAIGSGLKDKNIEDPKIWLEAFKKGVSSVSKIGGASEGDRTMLDALFPAIRTFEDSISDDTIDISSALRLASESAERGAENTKTMSSRAGRSNYVPEEILKDNPDPGAKAVAYWISAVAESVGRES